MVLTYDAYEETIEEQKKKDKRLEDLEKMLQTQIQTQQKHQKILEALWNSVDASAHESGKGIATITASRRKRNGIAADLVLEGKYNDRNNSDQDQDTFGITRMDIFRQKKDDPNDTPILTESRFMLTGKEKEKEES